MSVLFNCYLGWSSHFLHGTSIFQFHSCSHYLQWLEPKKIKSVTLSRVSPSIFHEVMGPDAMILVFWMLSFKPAFSLSIFTFIKFTQLTWCLTFKKSLSVLVTQLYRTLCNPMDFSPPASFVHGILQARMLGLPFLSPRNQLNSLKSAGIKNSVILWGSYKDNTNLSYFSYIFIYLFYFLK